mmetsp:Transcript_21091/g.60256  ORF Transcript_21091/g.60256 Transcript_21091/m.60256 type:complete len:201 (+) Transcript_21091:632-1234(+)
MPAHEITRPATPTHRRHHMREILNPHARRVVEDDCVALEVIELHFELLSQHRKLLVDGGRSGVGGPQILNLVVPLEVLVRHQLAKHKVAHTGVSHHVLECLLNGLCVGLLAECADVDLEEPAVARTALERLLQQLHHARTHKQLILHQSVDVRAFCEEFHLLGDEPRLGLLEHIAGRLRLAPRCSHGSTVVVLAGHSLAG